MINSYIALQANKIFSLPNFETVIASLVFNGIWVLMFGYLFYQF